MKADIYRIIGIMLFVTGIILRQFGILDFVQGICASLSIVLMVYGHINKPKKQSNI